MKKGVTTMFHSPAGYIEFIWQCIFSILMFLVIINTIRFAHWLTLGLLIAGLLINIIFFLWNMYWKGDMYLRMKDDKSAVRAMLEYYNDYWHFSLSITLHAFLLLFIGIGIGIRFNTGDIESDESQLIIKFFALGIIGMGAILWSLFLNTHPYLHDMMMRGKLTFVKKGSSKPLTQ